MNHEIPEDMLAIVHAIIDRAYRLGQTRKSEDRLENEMHRLMDQFNDAIGEVVKGNRAANQVSEKGSFREQLEIADDIRNSTSSHPEGETSSGYLQESE